MTGISRFGAMLIAGAVALALGACTETLPPIQANASADSSGGRIAARPGVSPAGATVAFVNLGGAPAAVGQRFGAAMSQALGARTISSDEPAKANYLIRGHMSAYAVEGGTAIAYVWDIYGSDRRRRQRVEDEIVISGSAADPWSLVDDKALGSIAGRSADEIAAFLTHMPEAIAAATATGAGARQASSPQLPLAYAPLR